MLKCQGGYLSTISGREIKTQIGILNETDFPTMVYTNSSPNMLTRTIKEESNNTF